jgi:hypothetical protein
MTGQTRGAELEPRRVTLVLCRPDGSLVGRLPTFEVALPWWQEVAPVVDEARLRYGVDVTVLRLLEAESQRPGAGGPVAYLAELAEGARPPRTEPWEGADPQADEPLRQRWAQPGGPAADLAWADAALLAHGIPRSGPARQIRTWNLSSLWRLPHDGGAAWLKVVPAFFAHEGAALSLLQGSPVPPLIAQEGPRVLLEEVPGEDQYTATGDRLVEMVHLLVDLQAAWVDRIDELSSIGAPDWRGPSLCTALTDLVERAEAHVSSEVQARLRTLVATLPERLAAVAGCGLPDTLVHGDFHRGNLRTGPAVLVLMDWGDCGIGHPMLDQAAFCGPLPGEDARRVRAAWSTAWQQHLPHSDPVRAAAMLAPVAALRQALIYQVFLDGIEPAERAYHQADPGRWLVTADVLAAGG